MIIFPLNVQTNIIAQMLPLGRGVELGVMMEDEERAEAMQCITFPG